MITDSYDGKTPSITTREAIYGPQGRLCDVCIVTFSKRILQTVLERYDCRKLAEITSCSGNIPVYGFDLNGTTVAFYLSGQGACLAGGNVEESNWLLGARHYILFGSAGALQPEATRGKLVVPTEAYRDEGMSYHYAPNSDYIAIRNATKVAAWLQEQGAPVVTGRCWTTDAFFRETKANFAKRVSEGCLAVEMELAGIQAVCDFYGLELYAFLQTGDVLDSDSYDTTELQNANHEYANFERALKIAAKLTEEGRGHVSKPSCLPEDALPSFRTMIIDDYDAVYALWRDSDGIGLNDVDDSREGIARYLLRNPQTCFVATLKHPLWARRTPRLHLPSCRPSRLQAHGSCTNTCAEGNGGPARLRHQQGCPSCIRTQRRRQCLLGEDGLHSPQRPRLSQCSSAPFELFTCSTTYKLRTVCLQFSFSRL